MSLDLASFVERLEARHDGFSRDASALVSQMRSDGPSDPLVEVFSAFTAAVRFHMDREERFFFPSVRALLEGDDEGAGAVLEMIDTLRAEHQELLALQARLRSMAHEGGKYAAALVVLLDRFEAQCDVEDAVLLPAVRALVAA